MNDNELRNIRILLTSLCVLAGLILAVTFVGLFGVVMMLADLIGGFRHVFGYWW